MSNHIGKETFIEVGGKRYKLSRWTRELDNQFVEWALAQLPDPVEEARKNMKGFPEHCQAIIVKEALEVKRKRDTGVSEEIGDIRTSQKGAWKVLCLLLQKHYPDMTERDVGNLFDQCLEEHGADYLQEKVEESQGVVKKKDLPPDTQKKT